MSSGEIHGLHGASVGAIMYTNYHYTTMRPVDLVEGSAFVAVGLLSGRLPDLLEPATSPRHRAFFHSVLFMILLGALTYRFLIDRNDVDIFVKGLAVTALIAVGSHLLLDGGTPSGIPLA